MTAPSQVAYPWRAALRTGLQTLLAVMLALPLVAAVLTDALDGVLPDDALAWCVGAAAAAAAVATAITRIMAIPAISDLLTRLRLGPEPRHAVIEGEAVEVEDDPLSPETRAIVEDQQRP